MSVDAINDFLKTEAGRIGTDVNRRIINTSPWINMTPQEAWPEGMGVTIQTFEFDRPIISNSSKTNTTEEYDWGNVAEDASEADAYGGTCIPQVDNVTFSTQHRNYNLQQKAIHGPRLCVNHLRYTFVREKQMAASVKALADQGRLSWIKRFRDEYKRVSANLAVCDSAFSLDGDDYNSMVFPAYSGSTGSALTNGYLEYAYEYLNHQSAQSHALGNENGAPVYGLITSARSSRRVVFDNSDIRTDFRESGRVGELLHPLGVKYSYNGFVHMVDDLVDRWESYQTAASGGDGLQTVSIASDGATASFSETGATMTGITKGSELTVGAQKLIVTAVTSQTTATVTTSTGGVATLASPAYFHMWKKVNPYSYTVAGSVGKRMPNPNWLNATWEDSYIFIGCTCTSVVPRPITSVGMAKFNPVNYRGEFSWKNWEDEENNPDGNIGRFRGVLMNGTRPDYPEFGIVLRSKACPNAYGAVTTCAT